MTVPWMPENGASSGQGWGGCGVPPDAPLSRRWTCLLACPARWLAPLRAHSGPRPTHLVAGWPCPGVRCQCHSLTVNCDIQCREAAACVLRA